MPEVKKRTIAQEGQTNYRGQTNDNGSTNKKRAKENKTVNEQAVNKKTISKRTKQKNESTTVQYEKTKKLNISIDDKYVY